jgi:CMP-N-acetylneuraminic acid synthetase
MIVAIIPAKGGSTRLPNKNMSILNGQPMINYAIEYVKKSKLIDKAYITTDSDLIDLHCSKLGWEVIRRPDSLGGETPIIEVYKDALNKIKNNHIVDILVGVQPDHPDRNIGIDEAINLFKNNNADRLISTEADGTKNGAHYILSKTFLSSGISIKDHIVVDDCTNVHFESDLKKASIRLKDKC